jgi:hypothetical protein
MFLNLSTEILYNVATLLIKKLRIIGEINTPQKDSQFYLGYVLTRVPYKLVKNFNLWHLPLERLTLTKYSY